MARVYASSAFTEIPEGIRFSCLDISNREGPGSSSVRGSLGSIDRREAVEGARIGSSVTMRACNSSSCRARFDILLTVAWMPLVSAPTRASWVFSEMPSSGSTVSVDGVPFRYHATPITNKTSDETNAITTAIRGAIRDTRRVESLHAITTVPNPRPAVRFEDRAPELQQRSCPGPGSKPSEGYTSQFGNEIVPHGRSAVRRKSYVRMQRWNTGAFRASLLPVVACPMRW